MVLLIHTFLIAAAVFHALSAHGFYDIEMEEVACKQGQQEA